MCLIEDNWGSTRASKLMYHSVAAVLIFSYDWKGEEKLSQQGHLLEFFVFEFKCWDVLVPSLILIYVSLSSTLSPLYVPCLSILPTSFPLHGSSPFPSIFTFPTALFYFLFTTLFTRDLSAVFHPLASKISTAMRIHIGLLRLPFASGLTA